MSDLTPTESALTIGDRAVDADQSEADRSPARVSDVPETTAADHRIEAIGKTVAEANPDYPPDDRVIGIRFERAGGEPAGPTYNIPPRTGNPAVSRRGGCHGRAAALLRDTGVADDLTGWDL